MSKEKQLMNCPFCNGETKIKRCGLGYIRAICSQCKIGTSHCASIDTAINKWNKRLYTRDDIDFFEDFARIRDKYNLYERNSSVVCCPRECLLELELFIDEKISAKKD